ncbi:hypothetical protein GCM10027029_00520 [Conyzicola lurida]
MRRVDKQLSATLVIAFLVLALALLALGWRARKRRQSALAAPQQPPADLGERLGSFPGYYVSTTLTGDRLNRVAVRGLGFRAKTDVQVSRAGVVIPIAGQLDTFIPAGDITAVERATWTIDRVVEPDGLTMIRWGLAESSVESYFRVNDPEGFIAALATLSPLRPEPTERDSK